MLKAMFVICFVSQAPDVSSEMQFANAVAEDVRELITVTWNHVIEERRKLRSGMVHMSGTATIKNVANAPTNGPVVANCEFDFPNELLRYRISQPVLVLDQADGDTGHVEERTVTTVVTSDKQLTWDSWNPNRVNVYPRGEKLTPPAEAMDVRVLGITTVSGLKTFRRLDELDRAKYGQVTWVSGRREGKIVELVYTGTDGTNRLSIFVDTERGYIPILFQIRSDVDRDGVWSDPTLIHEVSWEQKTDCWVPTALRAIEGIGGEGEKAIEFNFNWESINGDIDRDLFDELKFSDDRPVRIEDHRLGEPITTDVILKGGKRMSDRTDPTPVNRTPPKQGYRSIYFWNMVGIFGVVAFYIGRKILQKRQAS